MAKSGTHAVSPDGFVHVCDHPQAGQALTILSAVFQLVEKKSKPSFSSYCLVAVMDLGRTIRYLVVNSIFGLIVLALAKFLGLPVPINWITVLFCALAGITRSFARDTIILDRPRYPHHNRAYKKQILGSKYIVASLKCLVNLRTSSPSIL